METCSDVSGWVTAVTKSSASSWINPPPPALPSVRCSLRYAEFAYGKSTASVNRLPCESFKSERTSEVICPAVLYALDPTTGIGSPGRTGILACRFVRCLDFNGDRQECLSYSAGSGDFCRYAATPITALINAAAAAMRSVAPLPDCKLKCCGSIPTAANPVSTPPAAPLMAAARIPFNQICKWLMCALSL